MNHHAALSPQHSTTVLASAGTGKTWLLVTRIVRLLLAGAKPDAILAITFTRKAAAEMQARLSAQLFELAQLDDAELETKLGLLGAAVTPENLLRARCLYEDLLRGERATRVSTFHAFCQDLLRRFPLEADVPPGFEMLEQTALFEQAALEALLSEATAYPNGATAQALDILFDHCGPSTQTALREFLDHRSDWWAFTEGQVDAVAYATDTLARQLNIGADDHVESFFCATLQPLTQFAELLCKHKTATNLRYAEIIKLCLAREDKTFECFLEIKEVFLTGDGKPRARKASKAQAKALGEEGEKYFLSLHEQLCEKINHCLDMQARRNTLALCQAWYTAGARLLEHYQRIKSEQRFLDFADLEWKAYQLLNHSDNAEWVQYKLDQRIDHILVDEFQDTNPTQWNLILPLLNELAAAQGERERSVFLVGDSKQSIYRFRRADPRLLDTAHGWLSENLSAATHRLDISWRSAPAIIQFINKIFSDGPLQEQLQTFEMHHAHHHELFGSVEILPLVSSAEAENTTAASKNRLRNPLQQPRVLEEDTRHYQEGRLIAARIKTLFEQRTLIGHASDARPLEYSDILILMRDRTHVHAYETALREAGIPYLGAGRGTLLDSLEVSDMLALLDILITPFNNLALAQVLRSPLFACTDIDLSKLAAYSAPQGNSGKQTSTSSLTWMERLNALAPELESNSPLKRAHQHIKKWQTLAGRIPVHDLLDHIYHEANVIARYEAAFPAHLKSRVRANLTRFIELALDVDSGRYPSLAYLRDRLRSLQQQQAAPDEAGNLSAQACVRILTIHAAKGLEAPVVFLADAANTTRRRRAYQALIDWPRAAHKPSHFLITGKNAELDKLSRSLLDQHEAAELREEANLLYVALSRAKQFLFISACAPTRSDNLGWYGMMTEKSF